MGGMGGMGGGGSGGSGGASGYSPCGTPSTFPANSPYHPPGTFLDLGHTTTIHDLIVSGDRLLTRSSKTWILWDTTTHTQIAKGYDTDHVALGDGLMLACSANQIELRSAQNGALINTIPANNTICGIAPGGGYIWTWLDQTGGKGALGVWTLAGLHTIAKLVDNFDYFYVAPDEVRFGVGAQQQPSVVNIIPVNGAPPTQTPPYEGVFESWFEDGERFITRDGSTLRIYSKAGVKEDEQGSLSSSDKFHGTGNYYWDKGYYLTIREVGGGGVPLVQTLYPSGSTIVRSKRALGVIPPQAASFDIFDLAGPAPVKIQNPTGSWKNKAGYIDKDLHWAVGNDTGVIYEKGTPQDPQASGFFGCGSPVDIAAAPTGDVAIATSVGKVLVYDINMPAGAGPKTEIPFNASRMQFSANGTVLAAMSSWDQIPNANDGSLRFFNLPQGTPLSVLQWPNIRVDEFSMSQNATTVGFKQYTPTYLEGRKLTDLSGTTILYQDSADATPLPSPDGTRFVLTNYWFDIWVVCTGVTFYQGTTPGVHVPGCAVGWIDDNRVLIEQYELGPWQPWGPEIKYLGSSFYDAQGNLLGPANLPVMALNSTTTSVPPMYVLSPTTVYLKPFQGIYDVNTGVKLTSLPTMTRAVTSGKAVLVDPLGVVVAQPY